MVKKKTTGSKVKKSPIKPITKPNNSRAPKVKWYVWFLFGLLIVILCNMAYKNVVTRRDVALLDRAEEKMRQIEFPGGKKGVIERYCSERSVKFGSPGKPNCGVGVTVVYSNTISEDGKALTTQLVEQLNDDGFKLEASQDNKFQQSYSIEGLEQKLGCTLTSSQWSDYKNDLPNETLHLYCQKEFQSKLYPIRD